MQLINAALIYTVIESHYISPIFFLHLLLEKQQIFSYCIYTHRNCRDSESVLQGDIFLFGLNDQTFISKIISDEHILPSLWQTQYYCFTAIYTATPMKLHIDNSMSEAVGLTTLPSTILYTS